MGNMERPLASHARSAAMRGPRLAGMYRVMAGPRQRGTVAVMTVGCLIVMIGFCGLALDIGQIYNRKMELQAVADAAALAAASQLNGTPDGIARARSVARSVVEGGQRTLTVRYGQEKIVWKDAAISFSSSSRPGAAWLSQVSEATDVAGLLYARVQTDQLGGEYGSVATVFMHVLNPQLSESRLAATAIAAKSSVNVTPLAICAMSGLENEPRNNAANGTAPANIELVQYGFRRGVAYDLMQLNPGATSPEHFVLDPETPPDREGNAANIATEVIAPYVCSGTMAVAGIHGADITVFRSFPLSELYRAFNSRFGDYTGRICHMNGAPPDTNVKPYSYTDIGWMTTVPAGQAARKYADAGKLQTVADPLVPPNTATAPAYGPLWAYARAVPYASYSSGSVETNGDYTPFASSAWPALYGPNAPVPKSYQSGTGTPYAASSGANFAAPPLDTRPGVRDRRVLNIPLLACPVTGPRARVVGVGRFFMTVPATATTLVTEFAGLVSKPMLTGTVELHQ